MLKGSFIEYNVAKKVHLCWSWLQNITWAKSGWERPIYSQYKLRACYSRCHWQQKRKPANKLVKLAKLKTFIKFLNIIHVLLGLFIATFACTTEEVQHKTEIDFAQTINVKLWFASFASCQLPAAQKWAICWLSY